MTPEATPVQVANPYMAPLTTESDAALTSPSGEIDALGAHTVEIFGEMRGWLLFVGWAVIPLGALAARRPLNRLAEIEAANPHALGEVIGRSLFDLTLAAIFVISGVLMLRCAGRIKRFTVSRSMADLHRAAVAQRAYWRFVGGCTAVVLLVIVLYLMAAVARLNTI